MLDFFSQKINRTRLVFVTAIFFIFLTILLGWFYYGNVLTEQDKSPVQLQFKTLKFPELKCNISDFGAIGNGQTKNTEAIEKAIENCSKNGGGTVLIPKGRWLTGPIRLKSNIELRLDKKAELIFTSDYVDYLPVVFSRFEGIELYNYSPMIYAENCENVAITGKGKINGQGENWWDWKKNQKVAVKKLYDMAYENTPVAERIFGTEQDALRPSLMQFINCKNIELSEFTVENGPMWTIHPIYSENIWIKNIKIYTSGPNTDGIVLDSSKNVLISGCYLETGDDAIAIKSGLDNDGWRINVPSENIVIRDCQIRGGNSAITIGSEMSGGIKNILLENNKIENVDQGFRIKSLPGRGGMVENIFVNDTRMENITKYAIQLDMLYEFSTVKSRNNKNPTLKNVQINNLEASAVQEEGIRVIGLPGEKIRNIKFNDIRIDSRKGIKLKEIDNVVFTDLKISIIKGPIIDIKEVKNLYINNLYCKNPPDSLLLITGSGSENINVSNSKCKAAKELDSKMGADANSVIFD